MYLCAKGGQQDERKPSLPTCHCTVYLANKFLSLSPCLCLGYTIIDVLRNNVVLVCDSNNSSISTAVFQVNHCFLHPHLPRTRILGDNWYGFSAGLIPPRQPTKCDEAMKETQTIHPGLRQKFLSSGVAGSKNSRGVGGRETPITLIKSLDLHDYQK